MYSLPLLPNFQPLKIKCCIVVMCQVGVYIRIVYTEIIEKFRPMMNKHRMLLGGKVLKGDHSFKSTKHMAKFGEASVFTGLYTITNEYEEIVYQVLVPSKSVSYLTYPFQKMYEAYLDYGYDIPEVFFIDNVNGDKKKLEKPFPSLKDKVELRTSEEIYNCKFLRIPKDVETKYTQKKTTVPSKMKSSIYYK